MVRREQSGRFTVHLCVLITLVVALTACSAQTQSATPPPLLVFAAASLKNAMDDVVHAFRDQYGNEITVSYAGSSTLARQIEAGAPADLFVSANPGWMDYLQDRGLIRADSHASLLANRLVLIAPVTSNIELNISPQLDMAGALAGGYLAVADTRAVPAGLYAKSALQALRLWANVEHQLAQAENVRTALALVARGEAPLGVVYASDALAEPAVRVVDRFPGTAHAPIHYHAAIVATSANPENPAFLNFLHGPEAGAIFQRWGFQRIGGR